MRKHASPPLGALLVIAVALTACGGGDDDTSPENDPIDTTTATTAAPTAAMTTTSGTTTATTDGTTEPAPDTTEPAPVPFELTSSAFADGEPIPERYSCRGADVSPELSWTDPPPGSVSLAIVMDDPDAVPVAGKVWDHWVLWGLPAEARSLSEGIPAEAILADGATQGTNSFDRIGYGGPCPPSGQNHEYVFTAYALDTEVVPDGTTKADLLASLDGHVLAESTLRGTFGS